jgi:hypothetical protein
MWKSGIDINKSENQPDYFKILSIGTHNNFAFEADAARII